MNRLGSGWAEKAALWHSGMQEQGFPGEDTKLALLFLIFLFIYLFIFGCVGSSFLSEGFL